MKVWYQWAAYQEGLLEAGIMIGSQLHQGQLELASFTVHWRPVRLLVDLYSPVPCSQKVNPALVRFGQVLGS